MSAALIAKFKAGKWATPAEIEAFVLEAGAIDALTVLHWCQPRRAWQPG